MAEVPIPFGANSELSSGGSRDLLLSMSEPKSPAFQFYPKDWLSSTRVSMMSLEEEGAYVRLLCHCWIAGNLPADPEKLARIIGKGGSTTLATTLATMFQPDPNQPGMLIHDRLAVEREKQASWREKSSYGGKMSAEQRKKVKGGCEMVSRVVEPPYQPNGNSSVFSLQSSSSSSNIQSRAPIAAQEPEDENEYFRGFPKKKNPTPGDEAKLTKDFGCRFPTETDVDFYAQKSGIPESFWRNWLSEMEGFVVLRTDMTEKRMLDAGGLPVMNWRTFLLALWTRQNNQKGSRQRAGFQNASTRRQLTREEELQEQLKECREAVTVPDALKDWEVEKEIPEVHWIRFKNCHQATITDRELYRRLYRAKQSRGEDTTKVLADLKFECECEWGKDFERDWQIFMSRKP